MVSAACNAGVSSAPSAAAMPPCAYPVFPSSGRALVRTSTRRSASPTAARNPATPPPITMKSTSGTSLFVAMLSYQPVVQVDTGCADKRVSRADFHHGLRDRHSMDPVRVDVATPSRSYVVTIADGALDRLSALLDDGRLPARRVVVSSPQVWRLHGPQLQRALDISEPILVPDGERFKQLPTVARIFDGLVRLNADRARSEEH